MPESATIIRSFGEPDEHREFPLGRFDLVDIGGMTVGRAEYEPGWRWSEHVGASLGQAVCEVAHLGLVLSGRNRIEMTDGRVVETHDGNPLDFVAAYQRRFKPALRPGLPRFCGGLAGFLFGFALLDGFGGPFGVGCGGLWCGL